jgi:hypothetical protein
MSTPPLLSEPTTYEDIRRKYLSHEASIQGVGSLYILNGIFGFFALIIFLLQLFNITPHTDLKNPENLGLLVIAIISIPIFLLGKSLRKLNPAARIPATILSIIGLIAFPLGTIIHAYILYLIYSQKGKMVFSPEYHDIIRQTPHIKYRTSIIVWIALGILALAVLLIIGVLILSSSHVL